MARIRSIHPALFTDEAFVGLSSDAQVLLLGLWTEADDQGVFEWKPVTLRMRLRPTKDGTIEPLLSEMEAANCILKYEIGGRQYGAIRNFRRFQKPKSPNAVHPITAEIGIYTALSKPISGTSNSQPASFPQNGEIASLMEEGGEDEGEEEGGSRAEFVEFWLAYPKKVGEIDAKSAYGRARLQVDAVALLAAAKRYGETVRRDKTEDRFIKSPAKWLDGCRWTDGGPAPAERTPDEIAAAKDAADRLLKRNKYDPQKIAMQ